MALKQFDEQNDKNHIFEIPFGGVFRIHNGKIFKKGALNQALRMCGSEIGTNVSF